MNDALCLDDRTTQRAKDARSGLVVIQPRLGAQLAGALKLGLLALQAAGHVCEAENNKSKKQADPQAEGLGGCIDAAHGNTPPGPV